MTPLISAIETMRRHYYEDYGYPPEKIWISDLLIAKIQKEFLDGLADTGIFHYGLSVSRSILGMEIQPHEAFGKKLPDYMICLG